MNGTYDLVIVGGGIAGLCAALAAPEGARIVVIDKGEARAGSSPLAQGGMAAAVGPEDSPELHARDTIAAGAGICDEDVVRDLCAEGPGATEWLISIGCAFDRNDDGTLHLAREGGQSVGRSVHWRDATGQEIVRALRGAVKERNVERVKAQARSLILNDGRIIGVGAAERPFIGRAALIATGGAGALWAATTNAPGATADGIVLAMSTDAQLADLEFMQFHPTALATPGAQRVLLTEALRGHGATLVNQDGERFVDELAPRHVVTKAILEQEKAFLDCRHIDRLDELFPTVVSGARSKGFDPVTDLLPVEPAAHYFIGGIAADTQGRTSIPGLLAAGECASTGMHGANRMAGNSLLETIVVGKRVGARVMDEPEPVSEAAALQDPSELGKPDPDLAQIMWTGVGPIRDESGLRAALDKLEATRSPHRELCTMIARAALARAESRGVHIRSDHPEQDPHFAFRSYDRRVTH